MTPPPALSGDAPIVTATQDVLGYGPFAAALAKGLVGREPREPREGFVVGLQGRWGMGKTSVINLVRKQIAELETSKSASERTRVKEFSPWLFAGLDALARGYLSMLDHALDDALEQGAPEATRTLAKRVLRDGSDFAAPVGMVGAAAGGAPPAIAAGVGGVFKGLFDWVNRRISNRPLEELIADLKAQLGSISCRILIVVDDLDRLQPDELRQVLTLVKTFGDLPGVTHLLAYDRAIVNAALEPTQGHAAAGARNPSYLDKIVQVELDLPPPGEANLRRMFFSKLKTVVGEAPDMDREDWSRVVEVAFRHYLRAPRDVVRLCNALSITWPGVAGEVYLPDLVAIEVLRHGERGVYDAIRNEREFLTAHGELLVEDEHKKVGLRIVENIPVKRRNDIVRLLSMLFPYAAEQFQIDSYAGQPRSQARFSRRIGRTDGFEAYFRFAPASDEIPVAEVREIRAELGNADYLRVRLRREMGRLRTDKTTFVAPLLEELRDLVQEPGAPLLELLRVLLELGDEIVNLGDEADDIIGTDNYYRIVVLFDSIIRRVPAGVRHNAIASILDGPAYGLGMTAYMIAMLGKDYDLVWPRHHDAGDNLILSEEQVYDLGRRFVLRVKQSAAVKDELWKCSGLDLILQVWKTFAGAKEPRNWVDASLADPEGFTALALSQMPAADAADPPHHARELRDELDPDLFDLSRMADLGEGYLRADRIEAGAREDVELFVRQARARLAREAEAQG